MEMNEVLETLFLVYNKKKPQGRHVLAGSKVGPFSLGFLSSFIGFFLLPHSTCWEVLFYGGGGVSTVSHVKLMDQSNSGGGGWGFGLKIADGVATSTVLFTCRKPAVGLGCTTTL